MHFSPPAQPPARRHPVAGLLAMLVCLLVFGVTATGVAAASSASGGGRPAVRPTQELAILLRTHKVTSSVHGHPSRMGRVRASRPITGERTVLPVVGRVTSANGARWLRVKVPGRPNGSKGWIRKGGTSLTITRWHLVVRTASRRILVYRHGRLVRAFRAIVGKPSTPTPHGRFFVEEDIRMLPGSAGAPFALALSARSNVYQEFEGGPGQIAIHGIENLGGIPGTAISHGCVRLATRPIHWLAMHVSPGVPVDITH